MARGFMSGFGPAFSKSLGEAQKRKAAEDQDIFKMQYQSYLSNQSKLNDWEREDSGYAATAEMLAAGTENPEDAYQAIYQSLKGGVSADFLAKSLKENNIEVIKRPEAPTLPTSEKVKEKQAVDQVVGKVNPVKDFFSGGKSRQQGSSDAAISKIALGTGRSEEEVRQTIQGGLGKGRGQTSPIKFRLTPKNSSQEQALMEADTLDKVANGLANAELAGDTELMDLYLAKRSSLLRTKALEAGSKNEMQMVTLMKRNDKGQWVAGEQVGWNGVYYEDSTGRHPVSELEAGTAQFVDPADRDKWQAAQNKALDKTITQMQGMADMITTVEELDYLLNENSQAGTNVANFMGKVKSLAFEGDAALSLFKQAEQAGLVSKSMSLDEQEAGLTSFLNSFTDIDRGQAMFRQIQIRMAYDFMRSNGQEGRDVSANEFDAALGVMFESAEPEKLMEHLRRTVSSQFSLYKNAHKVAKASMEGMQFERTYWFDEEAEKNITDLVGEDLFNKYVTKRPETQPNTPTTGPLQAPEAGTVEDGYRFKGGDPSDPNNWEKI